LYASLPADAQESWSATVRPPDVPGVFEWTGDFFSPLGLTWDFLLDGEAAVSLETPTMSIPECNSPVPAAVTVTGATLIVDADFPVPVQVNTWGRIKGLYR
jgi:hypothetical protein